MNGRTLAGIGAVGLLAVGAAWLALSGGDTGGPVGERERAEQARAERVAAADAAEDPSTRPVARPAAGGAAGGPGANFVRPELSGPPQVQDKLRQLGTQLEGARLALPDQDPDGAATAVLEKAVEELAALSAEIAAGNMEAQAAIERASQIRLDAAVGFDAATTAENAKELKEALGYDMTGGDELGWGVPLNEANFGELFGQEGE